MSDVKLAGTRLPLTMSIGIASSGPAHTRPEDLLRDADAAMYAAKTSGQPVCFHSPAGVGDRRKRLVVAEDLYTALERHELTVEYQPILTVEGALVGTEAPQKRTLRKLASRADSPAEAAMKGARAKAAAGA